MLINTIPLLAFLAFLSASASELLWEEALASFAEGGCLCSIAGASLGMSAFCSGFFAVTPVMLIGADAFLRFLMRVFGLIRRLVTHPNRGSAMSKHSNKVQQ